MNSVLIIDDNKELCALMKNAWNRCYRMLGKS